MISCVNIFSLRFGLNENAIFSGGVRSVRDQWATNIGTNDSTEDGLRIETETSEINFNTADNRKTIFRSIFR